MARYAIDPLRSRVWIDARSSLHPIHSETDGVEGYLELDLHDSGGVDLTAAPKGHLSLPVERLRSGNRLEDRELQRRIDARRHRTIDGELLSMEKTGRDGSLRVSGE